MVEKAKINQAEMNATLRITRIDMYDYENFEITK